MKHTRSFQLKTSRNVTNMSFDSAGKAREYYEKLLKLHGKALPDLRLVQVDTTIQEKEIELSATAPIESGTTILKESIIAKASPGIFKFPGPEFQAALPSVGDRPSIRDGFAIPDASSQKV